jgi:hypothetical protein
MLALVFGAALPGQARASNTSKYYYISSSFVDTTSLLYISSVPLNGTARLYISIQNPNNDILSSITLSDQLPAGLVIASPLTVATADWDTTGTVTAVAGASTVSLSGFATSHDGGSLTVNVTGTTAGRKTDDITANSGYGAPTAIGQAVIDVIAPPTISAAFGTSSITLGGTTSLTFTITNPNVAQVGETVASAGAAPAAPVLGTLSGIGFTDTLPAGLRVASPNGLTTTCDGSAVAGAGGTTISLTGVSLDPTASCQLVLNVLAVGAGSQQNSTGPVGSTEGGNGTAGGAGLTVDGPAPSPTPSPTQAVTPPPTSSGQSGSGGVDDSGLGFVLATIIGFAGAWMTLRRAFSAGR